MTESFDARRERRKPRLVRGVSSVSKWWRSYLENGSFDGVELWVAPTQEGHEELRPNAILRATMDSMPALAPDLTVLAEPPVTSIAARFARRLGAAPRTLEFEHVQQSFPTRRLLVYLQGGELTEDVKSVLRKVSKNRYEKLVVYSAARAPETAAKWGILIGETQPKNAHLCFEADRVAEILDLKPTTKPSLTSLRFGSSWISRKRSWPPPLR